MCKVMRLFTSFVRHPEGERGGQAPSDFGRLRADVQAVVDVVCGRDDEQRAIEKKVGFEVNLRGANLQGADLRKANLESVNLEAAHLEGARVHRARFDDVKMGGAVLASPEAAVRGLTQKQLDSCFRKDDW